MIYLMLYLSSAGYISNSLLLATYLFPYSASYYIPTAFRRGNQISIGEYSTGNPIRQDRKKSITARIMVMHGPISSHSRCLFSCSIARNTILGSGNQSG